MSLKKYRPPRPMDMKGGCSPQNALKLPEFVHYGNKFNKFFFEGGKAET
jgi:hypothetical protein